MDQQTSIFSSFYVYQTDTFNLQNSTSYEYAHTILKMASCKYRWSMYVEDLLWQKRGAGYSAERVANNVNMIYLLCTGDT